MPRATSTSKNIVVFFGKKDFEGPHTPDYPFEKRRYRISHGQLADEIARLGGVYWVVSDIKTYQGGGRFSRSWRFQNGDVLQSGPVRADVIFDKGRFTADDFHRVFNSPAISHLCTDKWESYKLFRELSPLTFRARTEPEYRKALAQLPGDYVVVKPVDGLQGKDVFIGPQDTLQSPPIALPAIVQAFLNSEQGIPGIVNGIHDFRITLLNGEVICALVRTPPPGQLVASISRGAALKIIERSAIPKPLLEIAIHVDDTLAHYGPRLFCVDMVVTADGPKIIELNSRVALREDEIHPDFVRMKRQLARVLMSLAP